MKRILGSVWMGMLTVALVMAGGGCSTNPATGARQLNAFSMEREIAMGAEAAPQFVESYGGVIPSPEIQAYVSNIGHRLAESSELPDLPWEFFVVDSQVINAFALPGGKVFMSRGLMAQLTSEAELAGVLGHEIGHVTGRHGGQQMTRAIGIQVAAAGLGIAGEIADEDALRYMGLGTSAGGAVYLLKYGRDQETQADSLGMRYMTRNGYNPVGQLRVMEVLQAASGTGGRPPEFFSTHPYPETRIERINEEIHDHYADYEDTSKYSFRQDEYKTQVLDRLAKLPPPKHTGQ